MFHTRIIVQYFLYNPQEFNQFARQHRIVPYNIIKIVINDRLFINIILNTNIVDVFHHLFRIIFRQFRKNIFYENATKIHLAWR